MVSNDLEELESSQMIATSRGKDRIDRNLSLKCR